MRYGDVLLSANGVRTRTVFDYVEAKGHDATGMDVVFFRQGEEHSVRLEYAAGGARGTSDILAELIDLRIVGES